MKTKVSSFGLTFGIAAALALALVVLTPRRASSIASLGWSWTCNRADCTFTKTTNNHGSYKYNFGDGSFSSCTSTGSASHTYAVGWGVFEFNVNLIGYGASGCSTSPDNITGCVITIDNSALGGVPPTSGTCGP